MHKTPMPREWGLRYDNPTNATTYTVLKYNLRYSTEVKIQHLLLDAYVWMHVTYESVESEKDFNEARDRSVVVEVNNAVL